MPTGTTATPEIVSKTVEGGRSTGIPIARRTARAAPRQGAASARRRDERPRRHARLERLPAFRDLLRALPASGAVIHTINPRLFPDQIAYIANHAEERSSSSTSPSRRSSRSSPRSCKAVKALGRDDRSRAHAEGEHPESAVLRGADRRPRTTGSNGRRSTSDRGLPLLHLGHDRQSEGRALLAPLDDAARLRGGAAGCVRSSRRATWCCRSCRCSTSTPGDFRIPAPLTGAKLVFPGRISTARACYELFEAERVTMTRGRADGLARPAQLHEGEQAKFSTLKRDGDRRLGCAAGDDPHVPGGVRRAGAARLGNDRDEPARHGRARLRKSTRIAASEERYALQNKQGRAIFGVDMRIVDEDGKQLPHDGKAFGDLQVRGPWIISSYFKGEGGDPLSRTAGSRPATSATIDPDGYIQITDRSKDVIKSGGEWISSIDLENIAVAHPAIAEAAVIGVAHPKWDERPIVVAVKKAGAEVSQRGAAQVLRGQDREVVDARRRGVRRRAAAHRDRQALEAHAAAAVQGLPAAGTRASPRTENQGPACCAIERIAQPPGKEERAYPDMYARLPTRLRRPKRTPRCA